MLDNDEPSEGAEWDPTSLCIVTPTGCVDRLEVPGEGTWVANDDGTLTFTPEPGFDGEATVKTFYKEPGGIRLQPENARLEPIWVPAGSAEVRIIGKVVAVMRVL